MCGRLSVVLQVLLVDVRLPGNQSKCRWRCETQISIFASRLEFKVAEDGGIEVKVPLLNKGKVLLFSKLQETEASARWRYMEQHLTTVKGMT